jgi:beta-glucosidase
VALAVTDHQAGPGLEGPGGGPARLPAGFLLGTATSAHQVEGGNDRSDWARFEAEPGRIARGERSGRAADHYHRVPEDVALMRVLGANAYRFSIEWSRLEPTEGTWDEGAWAHYVAELHQLREADITPMVTLLHFTLPGWLAERGGLTADHFPARFERFAAEAARRLGPEVDLWCTLNEPNVQMAAGYLDGVWPPGRRDPREAERALLGLLRGHAAAAAALRAGDAGAAVGIALNLVLLEPSAPWSLPDLLAARLASQAYNWTVYDAVASGQVRLWVPGLFDLDVPVAGLAGSADFVGVNYYTRNLIRFAPGAAGRVERQPGPGARSDLEWEIHPDGLLRLLRAAWHRYRLPLYVTENGIADAAGTRRPGFVDAHLHAVAQALREGIPVRGYFHWSLIDNFEWAEGFAPRFGLYRVDYATFERTPAPGAERFRAWADRLGKRGQASIDIPREARGVRLEFDIREPDPSYQLGERSSSPAIRFIPQASTWWKTSGTLVAAAARRKAPATSRRKASSWIIECTMNSSIHVGNCAASTDGAAARTRRVRSASPSSARNASTARSSKNRMLARAATSAPATRASPAVAGPRSASSARR